MVVSVMKRFLFILLFCFAHEARAELVTFKCDYQFSADEEGLKKTSLNLS